METSLYEHDDFDSPPRPGRWDFLFSWTGLFLFGWVLYELTSQAFLGVTIFCCKLGWEDFRTGIWLRQHDPVSARGKMEMWIYIASGLWRVAISAFAIMMVLAVITAKMLVPPPDELGEAAITALVGFTVSVLATMRALGLAVWHRRKLWLHSSMHEIRKDNRWPPFANGPDAAGVSSGRRELDGQNKAGTLIIFSITAISFPLVLFGIVALEPFLAEKTRMILFFLYVFLGYPVIVLWMRDHQRRHLLAQGPEECWGADAVVEE